MSGDHVAFLVLAFVVLLGALIGLPAYLTAHRLDRLHIRTDLARRSLEGLLARRQSVAASVVRELERSSPGSGRVLAEALDTARAHPPHAVLVADPAPDPDRESWTDADDPSAEHAENAVGTVLAGVDPAVLPADLAAELADVSDRLSMARRFYNDAVRDTRALRERPAVRVLRLAGRAPMPDYVELVDAPDGPDTGARPV